MNSLGRSAASQRGPKTRCLSDERAVFRTAVIMTPRHVRPELPPHRARGGSLVRAGGLSLYGWLALLVFRARLVLALRPP